jgi:integrase
MPTPFNGKAYRVWGFQDDGRRKQFWFATEREANADCADRNRERAAYGSKVNLTSEARLEASSASELLKGTGYTILDAVRFVLEHQAASSASVFFSVLADRVRQEFARRLKANEASKRHVESVENALRKLEARFGSRLVSSITANEVRDWLKALPLAPKTRNKIRGYSSQIFGLAVEAGYAKANPFAGTKKFRECSNEENGEISILSSDETARLLKAAEQEVIPFLALWFFAGVRRSTLERLDWSEVKMAERRVIVPRYKSKDDNRYQVTLSDNLIEWLTPYVQESGSLIVKFKGRPSKRRTRRLVVEAAARAGVTLPDNAGRHTFISVHVAQHESIDKTATNADNSAAIIKRDYLDIATREEAAKFWAIRP